ncbi:MAG: hypothetical protein K0S81_2011, partial [Rhodospirillales bacterium]|nr:hypothetical protein [Rhodospirillales bacterium]
MSGHAQTTSAQPGRASRTLRITVLGGTSLAVFALLGGMLAEPSFAGRALRVKPAPAEVDLSQIDVCLKYGETSVECLDALADLAPAAGPGGYEVHEWEPGRENEGGGSSGGGSSGGSSSGGSSSGGSSSGGSSSGGSSSGGSSSGGSSSGGSSSGGGSSGGSSSGGGSSGCGCHGGSS